MSDRIDHATVLRVAADLCDAVGDEHIGRDINAASDYIDQLIRERDELRGSKDQLVVALETVERLQAENERLHSCVSVATAMEQLDMLMAENERLREFVLEFIDAAHGDYRALTSIYDRASALLASKEQES